MKNGPLCKRYGREPVIFTNNIIIFKNWELFRSTPKTILNAIISTRRRAGVLRQSGPFTSTVVCD